MLKDSKLSYNQPYAESLDADPLLEAGKVLFFIDYALPNFPVYYKTIKDADRENRISDFIVHFFQVVKANYFGGFCPYDFRKNPTQASSTRETDIGVFVLSLAKPITILEFEAKRLSVSSNNQEYVYGERGGIERFKRGWHSSHLTLSGMLGYVQDNTADYWIEKINKWIISQKNSDNFQLWEGESELLKPIESLHDVEKYISSHNRVNLNPIIIHHYFIKLV